MRLYLVTPHLTHTTVSKVLVWNIPLVPGYAPLNTHYCEKGAGVDIFCSHGGYVPFNPATCVVRNLGIHCSRYTTPVIHNVYLTHTSPTTLFSADYMVST